MTKKKLKKIINQVPVGYYQHLNIFQEWWHSGKFKAINKILKNEAPRTILDLGCNDGTMTVKISKLFPNAKRVVAIDLFEPGINYAKKLFPWIEFKVGDIQDLKFNEKFDLVTCLETIEHVSNPGKLVLEIKKALSKKGIAVIEMDSGNLLFRLAWGVWTKMRGKVWKGSHLWKTDKKRLNKLLEKSGLKIEEIKPFNFGMGVVFKIKK